MKTPVVDPFVARVIAMLVPLGPVIPRRLFSGYGLYLDGTIFAVVFDGALFLKADDQNRRGFERRGFGQLTYESRNGIVVLPYWGIPARHLKDHRTLRRWARTAYEAGVRSKAKKSAGGARGDGAKRRGEARRAPVFEPDF